MTKKIDVQPKKWCPSHKFFYVLFLVTQFFLLGFSCSSDNTTANNKKNTSKSISVYLRQLYNICTKISLFHYFTNMGCLYIHVCLKIRLCLKMRFSTSFDITWYAEAVIYTKKSTFLSFHNLLFLVNDTGEIIE